MSHLLGSLNLICYWFSENGSGSPLPDYLPEDDITSEASDKAVAPHGIKETATNWLSSAATFLQRSFYW